MLAQASRAPDLLRRTHSGGGELHEAFVLFGLNRMPSTVPGHMHQRALEPHRGELVGALADSDCQCFLRGDFGQPLAHVFEDAHGIDASARIPVQRARRHHPP
eukprot:14463878-Alexandrium_andersonii.AAC.1